MLQRHQPRRQLARDLLARFCPGSQVPEPFSQLIFHPHLHLAHRWAAGQQGTSGKHLIRGQRSPKGQAGQERRLYPEFNSVSAPAVGLGQLPWEKALAQFRKQAHDFMQTANRAQKVRQPAWKLHWAWTCGRFQVGPLSHLQL